MKIILQKPVEKLGLPGDVVEVDRKDVHLDEPIRSVGTHEVRVHLFPEVDPVITVEVLAAE